MVKRSSKEETWNAGTHLFGAVAALVGLVWMFFLVGDQWGTLPGASCLLYSVCLLLMYVMSTLSHAFEEEKRLHRFRALDQAFIYLLITGTYTPFSVYYWNTSVANALLLAMWVISIGGFIAKLFFSHRVNRVSIFAYVALGWMPIIGLPFQSHWPIQPMLWILAGGIVYSLGTLFLVNDRKAIWLHSAWHLSVMAASAIHFAAVVKFVALAIK
jgi:hemolysin III